MIVVDATAGQRRSFLAVTGGHRVDLDAFAELLAALAGTLGWRHAHATQPGAQQWLDGSCPFDAVLLHDIAGLHLKRGEPPAAIEPTPDVRRDIAALLDRGTGLVVLHHALASWPSWDGWAEAIGGRFFYAPGTLRGEPWASSGYRMTTHTVRAVAPDHPVCAGIEPFTVDDERYCCPVLDDRIVALLRTDSDGSPALFTSTFEQVLSRESLPLDAVAPQHPPASDVVAWAASAGASPIVFVEPGDSGATFGHPMYRRLLANALAWVASPEARAWAAARRQP